MAEQYQEARQRAEDKLPEMGNTLELKTRQLAESRALMKATLEATGDAILVTNPAGEVIHYNARFRLMWGLSAERFERATHRDLFELTKQRFVDPAAFVRRIEEIYASTQDVTDELRLADGKVIERFSKVEYLDEQAVGRVWSFREVTDRERAEQAGSLLAAIVESSDDAIASKTLQGIITSWNSGAERMFGYRREEVVGKHVTILFPVDRTQEEETIIERLQRGERIEHYETVRRKKDGTLFDVSLTVSPVKDSNGNIIGASKIARDISARKQLQQELDQLLQSERVARAEAERANLVKDEFLATLSHELRTPLSAILGWSQILAIGGASPEDLAQGLETIERNARIQSQLIEDLLDMSRIMSGKVRLDVQPTDLARVVEAALDSVRPSADAKEIRLRKVLDPHAGPVSGDPTRLQQVVWNLLTNAIKFTPKGGRVDVLLERVNSHLEITVLDTGAGINPEFLSVIFDRFRQADASTTRKYGGLGLGLSIVKHLVELHGGTVRAKSGGEGQGATFIVILPLAPVRDAAHREHPTARKAAPLDFTHIDLSGLKILVVDDEPDARMLIERLLRQCRAHVSTAESAAEGLGQLISLRPDVLVSDIGMPEVDGYQFIRNIRRLSPEEGGRTPAIALTAFARSEDRTRAMMAGYQVHVAKPIEPQELIVTVASLAGRMT